MGDYDQVKSGKIYVPISFSSRNDEVTFLNVISNCTQIPEFQQQTVEKKAELGDIRNKVNTDFPSL